jgi:hypothetical protein
MLRNISLGLVVALSACGGVKVIERVPQQGGIVELEGADRDAATEKAKQEMAANCGPNNFHVVKEGEAVVGHDTVTTQQTSDTEHTSKNGRTTTGEETTTNVKSSRDATKWRIQYACGPAPSQPVAAPPAPEPQPDPNAPPPPATGGY